MELNDPRLYHRNELKTLGWELTVCNALSVPESPCFTVLKRKKPYGSLLYDFISREAGPPNHVLEVGGGYGFLIRAFLEENPSLKVTLWDISPPLLEKQKETLRNYDINVEERDVLEAEPFCFAPFDLVIMNEMMGDLPTLRRWERERPSTDVPEEARCFHEEAKRVIETYGLAIPWKPFNFNIGAILVLEKVLKAGVEKVFLSEHSCEATVPREMRTLLSISAPGMPEELLLYGHQEFTIKFSHLETLARAFSYRTKRGPLADFIPLEMSERLRVCLRAPTPWTESDEIIRQFVSDLYQYEYLLLTKEGIS